MPVATRRKSWRTIYRCSLRRPWKIEQRYETLTDAANDVDVARNAIRNAIENRTRCAGWYWRYEYTDSEWRPCKRTRNAPVLVGNVRYPTFLAACASLGFTRRQLENRKKKRYIPVIMGRC